MPFGFIEAISSLTLTNESALVLGWERHGLESLNVLELASGAWRCSWALAHLGGVDQLELKAWSSPERYSQPYSTVTDLLELELLSWIGSTSIATSILISSSGDKGQVGRRKNSIHPEGQLPVLKSGLDPASESESDHGPIIFLIIISDHLSRDKGQTTDFVHVHRDEVW